jgi:uncharacterized protein
MLNESLTTVSWRARPRSFVALMSLYESNYVRLGWLVEGITALRGGHCCSIEGDCDLLLAVLAHSAYTTTLSLTCVIPGAAHATFPDLVLRVYHDARLAEAQEWAGTHEHAALRALRIRLDRELDQRWARNIMLNKWLEYCVERGYRFSPATQTSA